MRELIRHLAIASAIILQTQAAPAPTKLPYLVRLEAIQAAASKNDPDALGKLALLVLIHQVKGSHEEAFKWATQSANAGSPFGICALGNCYEWGDGVTKNQEKAAALYKSCKPALEKLGTTGDPLVQIFCGTCYLSRPGDEQDVKSALGWFRKAADQGDPYGQYLVATAYASGKGTAANPAEAAKWLKLAADQNLAGAQNNLGTCYMLGTGVPKDFKTGADWYRKAAQQGDATGQANLGLCYKDGVGVTADYNEAIKWLRLAEAQGNEDAKTGLRGIYPAATQGKLQFIDPEPGKLAGPDTKTIVELINAKYGMIAPADKSLRVIIGRGNLRELPRPNNSGKIPLHPVRISFSNPNGTGILITDYYFYRNDANAWAVERIKTAPPNQ